ncbi:MAG: MBOAT family protein [Firmicutes bacterium]|nr:MBOAT family protein [Bacillota bacterium]
MVFSSPMFLFKFLPIALLLYYLCPRVAKNGLLLILSLIFYGWGEPRYILIMFASIFVDYTVGITIDKAGGNVLKKRLALACSMLFNLGILLFFKYSNFFIENMNALIGTDWEFLTITLPLGISFYTFQTMSYSIDVYRGNVKAEYNLIDFAAFVCLFPQLIAGPIVKYSQISYELKNRIMNLEQIQSGARLFIMGLASKVLIANNIGMLWDDVRILGFENISANLTLLGMIGYSLQIYFDFSGYSLMAIGLGKMLGFDFPQNFNYPFISKSATEFWRRWHMTLGSWFREYVYIPLGGNRCKKSRWLLNIMIVWGLTGFWHGANWNFIIWGLFYGILLILEKLFYLKYLEKYKALGHIYLILVTIIGFGIFAVTDFSQLGAMFASLFSFEFSNDWIYYLKNYGITIILGVLLSTPLLEKTYQKYKERCGWLFNLGMLILLFLSTAYLVDSTYNPFLYFRF